MIEEEIERESNNDNNIRSIRNRSIIYEEYNVINYYNNNLIPSFIKIHEVGPRDGLQNEQIILTIEERIQLIRRLLKCNLNNIEVGSFVSSKWVPQMSNTSEVYKEIEKININNIPLSVLTPNLRGFYDAINVNVHEIAVFAACSEEFTKKNINCTINESLNRYRLVCEAANQHDIRIRGYISCVLGCPYEGNVSNEIVLKIINEFFSMGCYEISLGDTIGAGTPESTHQLLSYLSENSIPFDKLSVHFHDTNNRALSNILVALSHGIHVIDSSVAGLGGCPYAVGSGGNVATEDVIWLIHSLGINTTVKMKELLETGDYINNLLNRETHAKISRDKLWSIVEEQSIESKNDEE